MGVAAAAAAAAACIPSTTTSHCLAPQFISLSVIWFLIWKYFYSDLNCQAARAGARGPINVRNNNVNLWKCWLTSINCLNVTPPRQKLFLWKVLRGHDSDNKYLHIILEHIAKIYPLFILICSNFYVRLLYAPFCSLSPFLGHQQAP